MLTLPLPCKPLPPSKLIYARMMLCCKFFFFSQLELDNSLLLCIFLLFASLKNSPAKCIFQRDEMKAIKTLIIFSFRHDKASTRRRQERNSQWNTGSYSCWNLNCNLCGCITGILCGKKDQGHLQISQPRKSKIRQQIEHIRQWQSCHYWRQ